MDRNLVEIGYISRTHGVRGDVVIKLYNIESKSLKNDLVIFLGDNDSNLSKFHVKNVRYGNKLILKFVDVDDVEFATTLIGSKVFISKDDIKHGLKSNEFLLNDLLGFKVITDDDVVLGIITGFSSNGVQDIAQVKSASGKKCDVLLIRPFLKEIRYDESSIIINFDGVVE